MPHLCLALDVQGAIVFLGISKAFDTIDREFLYHCLLEMGASFGMINLARLLLHDTRATTHVNGVNSTPRVWHSGVRQGCPLSPLLYLVMAQALTSNGHTFQMATRFKWPHVSPFRCWYQKILPVLGQGSYAP